MQEDSSLSEFKLGGAIGKFYSNPDWYHAKGYQHFRDWVQDTHGVGYRKAMYVMDIYTTLLSLDISWEQFEDIGWYKVAILLPVLKANPENLKEWVEKAKGSNSITLQAAVKQALKPDTDEKKPVSDIVTKTFKLHPDQKEIVEQALSLAKQKSGTAVDTGSLSN